MSMAHITNSAPLASSVLPLTDARGGVYRTARELRDLADRLDQDPCQHGHSRWVWEAQSTALTPDLVAQGWHVSGCGTAPCVARPNGSRGSVVMNMHVPQVQAVCAWRRMPHIVASVAAAESASAAAESAASASLLAEQAASQLVDSFRFQYQLLLENQPSEHEGPARRKVWEATVADVRQRLVGVCSEHVVLAMEQRNSKLEAGAVARTEVKQATLCKCAPAAMAAPEQDTGRTIASSDSEFDYLYSDFSSSDDEQA